MMTKAQILEMVEEEDVEFIRLQFTDIFGNLKNVAVTAEQLPRVLENKYVFEGTAMYGGFKIGEEDMFLIPDLETFVILPWRPQQGKVARLLCDVQMEDGSSCDISPRTILKKVIAKAKKDGYDFYVHPECEFFLFHSDENGMPTTVTHEQAGYMDVGPIDLGENARRDMVMSLEEMGFEIESSHHEKAPAQHEIDFRELEALAIADSVVTFRSAVKSIAKRFGLHATFMPKPKKGVAGSGMHLNISVYKAGRNIFNSKDGEVRDEAKWFMGGVMAHAKALCGITNPLVNSYKRISSGFEAPKDIVWTKKNQNALIRLRSYSGQDTKVELRFPDSAANPYLALAVCLAAGMDGLEKQMDAGDVLDVCKAKGTRLEELPTTLREAMCEFQQDDLVKEVLGEEFIHIYTEAKMQEWSEYMDQVCDWEVEQYLNRI